MYRLTPFERNGFDIFNPFNDFEKNFFHTIFQIIQKEVGSGLFRHREDGSRCSPTVVQRVRLPPIGSKPKIQFIRIFSHLDINVLLFHPVKRVVRGIVRYGNLFRFIQNRATDTFLKFVKADIRANIEIRKRNGIPCSGNFPHPEGQIDVIVLMLLFIVQKGKTNMAIRHREIPRTYRIRSVNKQIILCNKGVVSADECIMKPPCVTF